MLYHLGELHPGITVDHFIQGVCNGVGLVPSQPFQPKGGGILATRKGQNPIFRVGGGLRQFQWYYSFVLVPPIVRP